MAKKRKFRSPKSKEIKIFLSILSITTLIIYVSYRIISEISFQYKFLSLQEDIKLGKYDEAKAKIDENFGVYRNGYNNDRLVRLYLDMLYEKCLKDAESKTLKGDDVILFFRLTSYAYYNDIGDNEKNAYYLLYVYQIIGDNFIDNRIDLFEKNDADGNAYFQTEDALKEFIEIYIKKKMYDKALSLNERLLKKYPKDLYFSVQNAIIVSKMGRGLESIEKLENLIFTTDIYNDLIRDAMLELINLLKEYSLKEKISYCYDYILERTNRDAFWLESYRDYIESLEGVSRRVLALDREIKNK